MLPGRYTTTFLGSEVPVIYVREAAHAERLLVQLRNQESGLIAIDTETERLPKYHGRDNAALSPHLSKVRLLQAYTGRTAIVFDCKCIANDSLFTHFLEHGRFVGHNAVFDLQYFYKQFGCKKVNIGCTYLIAKLLIHATRPTDDIAASLKNLVNTFFKEEILKEMQQSDWSVPDLTWEQVEYAALDAIAAYKLAEKIAPYLTKYGLERIYKLYKDAQHPIARMQLNGIKLNVDKHRDLIVGWRANLYKARKEVQAITGLQYLTSTTLGKWLEKNLPPETLAIWPRTDTKRLATDAHVFADFDYLDIVKPFSEYQRLEKLCTAFGNNLIDEVNPETNRIHPLFRLAGARTGRPSCSSPNVQQMPRDSSFRKNFIPELGKIFVRADYNQIEIRVGAEQSRDPVMLKAYRDGTDLHALTAATILHKNIKDVTKSERQGGKAFNFGLMFGLGPPAFKHYSKKAYGVEVTLEQSKKGVGTWRNLYYVYRDWHKETAAFAQEHGYVCTPLGKRRCLDRDNCWGASANTPIQGGAAECALSSLIRLDAHGIPLVNWIHDEIIAEVKAEDRIESETIISQDMVDGFLDVFPNGITNKLIECGSGASWEEAKG